MFAVLKDPSYYRDGLIVTAPKVKWATASDQSFPHLCFGFSCYCWLALCVVLKEDFEHRDGMAKV